jgi:chlorophyllide a reductase subunit Z
LRDRVERDARAAGIERITAAQVARSRDALRQGATA